MAHARLEVDGASAMTLTMEAGNLDGDRVIAGCESSTATFTVAPNGALGVDAGLASFIGGLAADGSYGFFAGSTTDGLPPALYFFRR